MRTLAKGNRRVVWAPAVADIESPTLAEIAAGKDITCFIQKGGITLGTTDSDTTDESSLCDLAKGAAITDANYESTVTMFRDYSALGVPTVDDPKVIFAGRPYGYLLQFWGKPVKSTTVAAGDEVEVFGVQIDLPRTEGDDGSIKLTVKGVPTGELSTDAVVTA